MANSSLVDTVAKAMQEIFPPVLADSAWDNTGLLLEDFRSSEAESQDTSKQTILLTNDISLAVVEEAIQVNAKIIISYHPVIFKPIKTLRRDDPVQHALLKLAAHQIAVYCPHTAVDAVHGGLNDWLCDILLPSGQAETTARTAAQPIKGRQLTPDLEGTGYGRTFELPEATYFGTILKRLAKGLGDLRYLQVALPDGAGPDKLVSKIAVGAGSGTGVLKDCNDVDVLVCGEMSHHESLRHMQLGQIVVTAFHSNSERQYLTQRTKPKLREALKSTPFAETEILVSKKDRDPFQVIDVSQLG